MELHWNPTEHPFDWIILDEHGSRWLVSGNPNSYAERRPYTGAGESRRHPERCVEAAVLRITGAAA